MRRLIAFLLWAVAVFPAAAQTCYAVQEGDILRLGNALIERSFRWNDGALQTVSLTDKTNGFTLHSEALRADFTLGKFTPSYAVWEQELLPADALHPARLLVRVQYKLGAVDVRREYSLYEGVPAIACDTWLRGRLEAYSESGGENVADRKNIEFQADMVARAVDAAVLDQFSPGGAHWHGKAVLFRDVTDWNDNLVQEEDFIAYRKLNYRGNLLFARDGLSGNGFFFLKEAPCSDVQPGGGKADFTAEFGRFQVVGAGISAGDVQPDDWTRLYGAVLGVAGKNELDGLQALRSYQKTLRRSRDMIMMNTWGDRSQDAKVNEAFCLQELERAARLGVTVFQIDDGWQSGKSPNSKLAKGSFKNIWDNPDYWTPDPVKYPRGLTPVVERARELGLEVGLWYNPSVQEDFADWEKDAASILGLHRQYGINIFKIDGLQIPGKKAEERLRKLFDTVKEQSGGAVIFNLDATAGRRMGYHCFGEYGNIFLENRYTDWGNYYPYRTLRNLWQLSRYIPAECLQIEFLNPWRNAGKYPEGDFLAPANYSFDYLVATTLAAQPLAWMEASNLPEEAFETAPLLHTWRAIAADLHAGTILPVGDEPSGRSWTGFQSITGPGSGYLLLYREQTPSSQGHIRTWLPKGARVKLTAVTPGKVPTSVRVDRNGYIDLSLNQANSFIILKYTVK